MSVCSYCGVARGVNADHVLPRSAYKRLRLPLRPTAALLTARGLPSWLLDTADSCFDDNIRKGTRLLIPPSWAPRLDALNALGIGTFRVWDGSPEALREVVK